MARTAVVAGTASAVAGRVTASQDAARSHRAAEADRPAPAGSPPSVDDLYTQLTKLGELQAAGLLSEEEFAQQKARLLGKR